MGATRRAASAASITAGSSTPTATASTCRTCRRNRTSRQKVHARAYKVAERAGVIWVYMGAARRSAAVARDRGDAAAGKRSFHHVHAARVQLAAGAGRRHRHLAFQLAACRFRAARAGRSGQLADVPGQQPRTGLPRDGYRLGHDVLRLSSGRGRQDVLALRAFRLSVLDLHPAGRLHRSRDRARLGADGRHARDVRAAGPGSRLRAPPRCRAASRSRAPRRHRSCSRTPPTGSAAGVRCRTRRTTT